MFGRNTKGQFIKGHKTNVGRICLEETKNKIGKANKVSVKKYYENGGKVWCYGKKFSEKHRENISISHIGQIAWNKGIKTGIRPWLGKKRPIETREKIRNTLRRGGYIKCKLCGKQFWASPSGANKKYCSITCQYNDKELLRKNGIMSTIKQLNKRGLNKLELIGRNILQDIGIEFHEQVLMFNKFLVDVLISNKKLIIQWDGEYWHNKKENKARDKSSDAYLKKCGYNILRITDQEIKNDIHNVYNRIIKFVQ